MKNFFKVHIVPLFRPRLYSIALVVAIGLSFAACPNPDPAVAKKITITGLRNETGYVQIMLMNDDDFVAAGRSEISGDSATVDLGNQSGGPWTGSGSFFVELYIMRDLNYDDRPGVYVYTNGGTSVQQVSITGAVTTIAFSQFMDVP